MVVTENLTSLISEGIKKAQREEITFNEIYKNSNLPIGKNEFLFFIKPELTVESSTIRIESILDLIQEKIEAFGFNVHSINVLSASYLKEHKIAEEHYGVINKISSNPKLNLSETAKDRFKYLYGVAIEEVEYLGGHQFLDKFKDEDSNSLNAIWENVEDAWKTKYQNLPKEEVEKLNRSNNVRLAGGTYCKVIIKNEVPYIVLNGFNPSQIEHFTNAGRNIVTMTLSNNLSWKDARDNFIGKTNPLDANIGSIRRTLYENKNIFGLGEVSQGMNGVHLSAGPIEALIELKRFNSNFNDKSLVKDYSDFSFGKKLKEGFNGSFDEIVNNINVIDNGKSISIFDLTEEKDSEVALNILKKHFN